VAGKEAPQQSGDSRSLFGEWANAVGECWAEADLIRLIGTSHEEVIGLLNRNMILRIATATTIFSLLGRSTSLASQSAQGYT
jgi:hypothetical protein